MSIDPRNPLAGLKSSPPPDELTERIRSVALRTGHESGLGANDESRHFIDRLWSSRRTWIGFAVACLALVALDLILLTAEHPSGDVSNGTSIAREGRAEPCEQLACHLDAADRQLFEELGLDSLNG